MAAVAPWKRRLKKLGPCAASTAAAAPRFFEMESRARAAPPKTQNRGQPAQVKLRWRAQARRFAQAAWTDVDQIGRRKHQQAAVPSEAGLDVRAPNPRRRRSIAGGGMAHTSITRNVCVLDARACTPHYDSLTNPTTITSPQSRPRRAAGVRVNRSTAGPGASWVVDRHFHRIAHARTHALARVVRRTRPTPTMTAAAGGQRQRRQSQQQQLLLSLLMLLLMLEGADAFRQMGAMRRRGPAPPRVQARLPLPLLPTAAASTGAGVRGSEYGGIDDDGDAAV